MLGKFCAIRSYFRPHRKCSLFISCIAMESWTLGFIHGNAEIEPQNISTFVILTKMSVEEAGLPVSKFQEDPM